MTIIFALLLMVFVIACIIAVVKLSIYGIILAMVIVILYWLIDTIRDPED